MVKIEIEPEQFKNKSVWELKMGIQRELEKIKIVYAYGNGRQNTIEPYASFDFSKDGYLQNTKIMEITN